MDTLTEKGALERIANWLETSGGKLNRTQVQQMVEFARAAADANGWLDIATAPKDGTWIMTVVDGFTPDIVQWSATWGVWCDEADADRLADAGEDPMEGPPYGEFEYNPTHWRPLPASPSA